MCILVRAKWGRRLTECRGIWPSQSIHSWARCIAIKAQYLVEYFLIVRDIGLLIVCHPNSE